MKEKEILTSMREFEREGLDSVSYVIRSLERESERKLGF